MADEDSGTNNQPDPEAPGSKRIVPSFAKALMKSVVAGASQVNKVSNSSGDSALDAILAATSRRSRGREVTSKTNGISKSTTNSEPTGFGKKINLKYRKVYGAKVNTGDDRIDSEVARVLSQVAGAVNDFQENVTKTFRIVGNRLVALEKGTPQLVRQIDTLRANQKTLADQVGYILKAMDEQANQVKKAKPSNLDKQLQSLRERAAKMERDERGRFVRKKDDDSSDLVDVAKGLGGAWAASKVMKAIRGTGSIASSGAKAGARALGSTARGVGSAAVSGAKTGAGVAGRAIDSAVKGARSAVESGAAGKIVSSSAPMLGAVSIANMTTPEEDKTLDDAAKRSRAVKRKYGKDVVAEARVKFQPWYARTSIDADDGRDEEYVQKLLSEKSGKKSVQNEKSSGSFWSSLFGSSASASEKKETKSTEEKEEYKLTPYNLTFDVGNDIYFKAFKDLRLKGERITIEADELKFNVNRVTGITAGAIGNADGKGGVRNFRKGVTTPQGSREEPSQGFFGTNPGQIGAERIGPGGAPALSMDGIKRLRSGISGGYSGAESVGIPQGGARVPNDKLLDRYKEGTPRLIHRGGHLQGTDPKLLNVLKEASKDLPAGYRAEIISAHDGRASGTTNHPAGIAVDLQIYDDKGRRVPNLKGSWGYGIYEKMYQSAYTRGKDLYPKEKLLWGGGFASGVANDKMHYQWQKPIPGSSQGMRAYDPTTGINPQYKQSFDPSGEAMSPEQIKQYQDSIKEKIRQEKSGVTPTTEAKEKSPASTPAPASDRERPQENTSTTLASQRSAFMDQMKKNPHLMNTAMAMMMSEEGGDSTARKALLESVMNRSNAHGYKDLLTQGFRRSYYAPFRNGSFDRNLQKILGDPKLRQRLMSEIEEVGRGSNFSNFATQNGSAGVGANARRTQSVGLVAGNGETFSRKDRPEFAGLHGAGYTKAEADWHLKTQAAIEQESKEPESTGPKMLPAPSREAADYHLVQPKPMKDTSREEQFAAFAGADMIGIGLGPHANIDKWPTYAAPTKEEADKAFGPPPAPVVEKQPETKEAQNKQNYYDTRISQPKHDAEAAPPTPGSDGYGSGACDPDGGGICAV